MPNEISTLGEIKISGAKSLEVRVPKVLLLFRISIYSRDFGRVNVLSISGLVRNSRVMPHVMLMTLLRPAEMRSAKVVLSSGSFMRFSPLVPTIRYLNWKHSKQENPGFIIAAAQEILSSRQRTAVSPNIRGRPPPCLFHLLHASSNV
jgi:hypothetical protein